jgi:4-amino-4-deoxy-L-arabinose transferase-like glycosyltransferase
LTTQLSAPAAARNATTAGRLGRLARQRALESGRLPWLLASAFFLGCGFNTKMLQAYLLLPALALVYLLFAQGG